MRNEKVGFLYSLVPGGFIEDLLARGLSENDIRLMYMGDRVLFDVLAKEYRERIEYEYEQSLNTYTFYLSSNPKVQPNILAKLKDYGLVQVGESKVEPTNFRQEWFTFRTELTLVSIDASSGLSVDRKSNTHCTWVYLYEDGKKIAKLFEYGHKTGKYPFFHFKSQPLILNPDYR